MNFALTVLRVLVGGLFVGHGLQKLAGKFGGHGLDGTGQFFESIGLKPGKTHAALAGASRRQAARSWRPGFLTPAAASMLTGTMTTAIKTVHIDKGVWNSDGGYEFNAVLIAVAFTLAAAGPGRWSLDNALGTSRTGVPVALAAVASGALGGLAVARLASHDQDDAGAEDAADAARAGQAGEPEPQPA